ncbi:GNAT family N-acetyltransferase [Streptomyces longispororuber]|uniref:GNAT family N-acetyltransferase n=1 Tax=Streptomyces longispororuber TaxID=68230 RepID=UPI0021087B20|nr:GNAT family N-acetyltransferase [Streptomyces longispororuber]MCQ4211796.1 GNAT family N-acetyltransferase [Streptomyces longispororuber]
MPPAAQHLTQLDDPHATEGTRRLAWLAQDAEGGPVGSAFLRFFDRDGQRHLAELVIRVHPAERRAGVGSRLLAAAVEAARADGRSTVLASADGDSPGELFLAAREFRRVLRLTYTRLTLADADVDALTATAGRPHPGYRLTEWDGTVPDELAASFALSRGAMDDMPMDDADYGKVAWDVDRVRAVAEAVARRGDLLHTLAVIDESDGAVCAFTELVVPGGREGDGEHYGTGVLPPHRGRGLAGWMKATQILRVRDRHPRLTGLVTDTADSNKAMRAVNDALGYVPTHRSCEYQLDL